MFKELGAFIDAVGRFTVEAGRTTIKAINRSLYDDKPIELMGEVIPPIESPIDIGRKRGIYDEKNGEIIKIDEE
jgi:hypothetical protein